MVSEEVEVIERYERGKETTYSLDGGKTYLTRKEIHIKAYQQELIEKLSGMKRQTNRLNNFKNISCRGYNQAIDDVLAILKEGE